MTSRVFNSRMFVLALLVLATSFIFSYLYFVASSIQSSFALEESRKVLRIQELTHQEREQKYIQHLSKITAVTVRDMGFISVEDPLFVDRHTSVARLDN